MALSQKSLVRVATLVPVGSAAGAAQGKQSGLLTYATDDAAATVEAAGYFNGAREFLRKGDLILASMVNGGTSVGKSYVALTVPATGNCTIAVFTATAG